jgi:hypothetical protein
MRRVGKAQHAHHVVASIGGHGASAPLPTLQTLVLYDRLPNLGATVRAFIGEVDLRHAPMRLDVSYEHRKPDAARTNDEGRLDVVVMVNIGWHDGTPHGSIYL